MNAFSKKISFTKANGMQSLFYMLTYVSLAMIMGEHLSILPSTFCFGCVSGIILGTFFNYTHSLWLTAFAHCFLGALANTIYITLK